ncbi:hypothetical protein BDZ94DRAFT_1178137 [Collybia nuda]|uniref:Uncharacterized protein n=1 Tax=Collybia nuda TaxID=64659 RepID=A0A9P5XRB5_9AGAR|nr:hypothetical protein BDZ94DRAFT_1178137 [Collybia nuda]
MRPIGYEREHRATIRDFDIKTGNLVLIRNSEVEMSLNSKMKPRYNGPMIVLRRNRGGAYILCEMDGSVWQNKVAAFRLVPYYARTSVTLPDNLQELIDISARTLNSLADSNNTGEMELYKGRDWNFDGIRLNSGHDPPDEPESQVLSSSEEEIDNDDSSEDDPPQLRSSNIRKNTFGSRASKVSLECPRESQGSQSCKLP